MELLEGVIESRIIEYEKEAERLDQELKFLGLHSSTLPKELNDPLTCLAEICATIELRSPTISNLYLGLSDFLDEINSQEISRSAFEERKKVIDGANEEASNMLKQLEEIVKKMDNSSHNLEQETQTMIERTQRNAILKAELEKDINESKKKLEALNYSSEGKLTHKNVTAASEKLKNMKEELAKVSAELQSFQSLPPDFNLAQQEIETLKAKVASTNAAVQKAIENSIHLPSI